MSMFKNERFTLSDPKQKKAWENHLKESNEFRQQPIKEQYEAMLRGEAASLAYFSDTGEIMTMCRNEILAHRAGKPAPAKPASATPAAKPAAITQPAPAAKPAAAPAAAKPAVPAVTGTVTAAQFQSQTAKPTMCRAEWLKLSHTERNEWFRKGGKLVD